MFPRDEEMAMGFVRAIVAFFRKLLGFGGVKPVADESTNPSTPADSVVPMKKNRYALLVGINKYAMPGADLRGCVNDVESMWERLTKLYHFDPDNIRVLTDARATKANIIQRLEWLVQVAKAGDHLVFHFSGHGSQTRDRNNDELDDHLDELLCTHDMDWDDPLTDDLLATYFKRVAKKGARLTFVADCCHSGTVDRGTFGNPHPTGIRYLRPPVDIMLRSHGRSLQRKRVGWREVGVRSNDVTRINPQNHMLISGCRDDQTSADAYIDGEYQGALTATLTSVLDEMPDADWISIHQKVIGDLKAGRYSQIPQLSGPDDMLDVVPFGGI